MASGMSEVVGRRPLKRPPPGATSPGCDLRRVGGYTPGVQQVVESLLPLALLVVLGAALQRFGFFDAAFRKGLDRLVYWVALPALIIGALAKAPPPEVIGSAGAMIGALCGATLGVAVLAWGAAGLLRLPRPSAGVFTQAAFRGNLAFVGLPVIALATGNDEVLLAKAALTFAPTVVLFNVLGVAGLVAAQHRLDKALPWRVVKSLARNPLLLACLVGMVVWRLDIGLPTVAVTTIDLLGKPAGPLALISLGGVLVSYPVGKHVGVAGLAAGFKCGLTPVLAWGLARWWGVGEEDLKVLLILAACPTAVASYVLATQLRGDATLAAATIVISTVVSGVSLGVVLAMG